MWSSLADDFSSLFDCERQTDGSILREAGKAKASEPVQGRCSVNHTGSVGKGLSTGEITAPQMECDGSEQALWLRGPRWEGGCEMFAQAGCKEVLHPSEVLRHCRRHCLILKCF